MVDCLHLHAAHRTAVELLLGGTAVGERDEERSGTEGVGGLSPAQHGPRAPGGWGGVGLVGAHRIWRAEGLPAWDPGARCSSMGRSLTAEPAVAAAEARPGRRRPPPHKMPPSTDRTLGRRIGGSWSCWPASSAMDPNGTRVDCCDHLQGRHGMLRPP